MQNFSCAAVLFDLDGVLVDSTHSVERQWRLWASEIGVDPEQVLEIAHGRRTLEVVRLLRPDLDAEGEVIRLEAREAEDTEGVVVMPGAAQLLASIPTERWAIVTSGTRHLATSRLRLAQLPIPRVLVCGDEVVNGKPHPEPYLKGAQLLGVDPRECLVIEDAPAGIASGHAGGMRVIALASTYAPQELEKADAVIRDLSQVEVTLDPHLRLALRVE
jgi:sugar-phosphatase